MPAGRRLRARARRCRPHRPGGWLGRSSGILAGIVAGKWGSVPPISSQVLPRELSTVSLLGLHGSTAGRWKRGGPNSPQRKEDRHQDADVPGLVHQGANVQRRHGEHQEEAAGEAHGPAQGNAVQARGSPGRTGDRKMRPDPINKIKQPQEGDNQECIRD